MMKVNSGMHEEARFQFEQICPPEDMYEQFDRDSSIDFILERASLTRSIKISKNVEFDSNILFFEEDFNRRIDMLTGYRDDLKPRSRKSISKFPIYN